MNLLHKENRIRAIRTLPRRFLMRRKMRWTQSIGVTAGHGYGLAGKILILEIHEDCHLRPAKHRIAADRAEDTMTDVDRRQDDGGLPFLRDTSAMAHRWQRYRSAIAKFDCGSATRYGTRMVRLGVVYLLDESREVGESKACVQNRCRVLGDTCGKRHA